MLTDMLLKIQAEKKASQGVDTTQETEKMTYKVMDNSALHQVRLT